MPPDGPAPCEVVIVGAGTLGAVLYDCLQGDGRWRPIGFIDDTKPGSQCFGLPVHGTHGYVLPAAAKAIMAVAAPQARRSFVQAVAPLGLAWATFVDRRSHVSGLATLGTGCVVLPFATVGPLTKVGNFGYVGAYAAIGSSAELGDYASLMARASAGGCKVGECCQIGFNSACLDGAVLGDRVTLAPYTWVRKPVPAGAFVTGNPARYRRARDAGG